MSQLKNNEKLYRPEEAAKLLNVCSQTLINWENNGRIKCVRTKGNRLTSPDFTGLENLKEVGIHWMASSPSTSDNYDVNTLLLEVKI
jgi:hypothetical protein